MYKKILVPLDGSRFSEAVLPHIHALAKCTGAEVVLLRVVPTPLYETLLIGSVPSGVIATPEHDTHAQAEGYLQRVAYDELPDVSVRLEVCGGPTADTILDYAAGIEADLIAMTTHGRSGLAHLVMGSVAEEIVRRSHLPVLLVRPD
ncbi:MAG TPA: universal stress protein [Anaerolineae bacterium]|nr:universal stress protein [Anaerolineae bacterium]